MALDATFYDPLAINLKGQTSRLIDLLPSDSPHSILLRNVSSRSELLQQLSFLLAIPAYTMTVATFFRPLLLDLCARWLHDEQNLEDRFEALCLLIEVHPEIFPVLSKFIQSFVKNGPLSFLIGDISAENADRKLLHRMLLAYYRILQANRILPDRLSWPLSPLSKLIWGAYPDTGVRFLAIRCYALHLGIMEAERIELEKKAIGDAAAEVDCPIEFGTSLDGTAVEVDGWIMPALEVKRVTDARNAHLQPQEYYSDDEGNAHEPIHPAELSPLIVNIHGILLLRDSPMSSPPSPLVDTITAAQTLRTIASHHSLRVPVLLTSAPSSGKSLLLSHLATRLHPTAHNQIVTVHFADTSLDPRSLLGSYVSSPTRPGTFEWKEGVLVRAMREGKWIVFEDIDRGSTELLGTVKPLVESLSAGKWIGGRATLDVPSRGTVEAAENFAIFATRSVSSSRNGAFPPPTFFGAHKFYEVIVPSPNPEDLQLIIATKFARLAGPVAQALIKLWNAVCSLGPAASARDIGLRELEKLCMRTDNLLPSSYEPLPVDGELDEHAVIPAALPNPSLREDIYLEARDVFFGAGYNTASARAHAEAIAAIVAQYLGISHESQQWVVKRTPEYDVEKDVNGSVTTVRIGRTRLQARRPKDGVMPISTRPFAMHKPAVQLLSRISTAVSLGEPVLLTGETGTGKTSVVTHLASLLHRPLISLNLSNQTEASDLLGGHKPVDARVPGSELQERFLELFGSTFSRKKNAKFEDSVRVAVRDGKWKRVVGLWTESAKLAKERIQAKVAESQQPNLEDSAPRKRRKVELSVSQAAWDDFERDVQIFDVQHVQGQSKFAFSFVEGPLVKALRAGDWILLDEVNLASAETLECISSLLHSPTASITLTEQGSLEPVPRHPDFRLFACMNPATDVGKKDLPPQIRSRFTEIDVPPPDADKETLLTIISQYIGGSAVGDKGAIMDVAEFYVAVRTLAEERKIADGSNHRPHFSMRTLARALTFASDMAPMYSLRRALWEGCLMAFTMVLDETSAAAVTGLAQKHLLAGVRNPRSLLAKEPVALSFPAGSVKLGPFYLERGPLPESPVDDYIMTPSVERKLIDLARIIAAKRFPVLIEGPTSSGKTSSIEYLAKRTGHRFVRINNHEHTDIQEYLGTYISDPVTGKLVFKDGLLVRALRTGDWIVLDELNLAPTDVLEALNRLLDDNRELVIPETQEVVRPHPHFMLFATQNPPGLYGGRKVLSRAFRNRFLEVHFEDVPQSELETILCQRCRIAPSHGQRIVSVFRELQKRRQSSRVFESKHGFATLRDLFRWAGRDALDYQELATNGYMLLAERARRDDDKAVVKEVIESIMKVKIREDSLYDFSDSPTEIAEFLGCPLPQSSQLVWTKAMRRLFVLIARALRFNEPVLLVGETGSGKTSVCQVYAESHSQALYTVNCHQNTETADIIGGLRPIRNRAVLEAEAVQDASALLTRLEVSLDRLDITSLITKIDALLESSNVKFSHLESLRDVRSRLRRLTAMFEWHDGPLVEAMRQGDVFLLDEISLADDSVLERLNSVLEPGRTIVLAERGGNDSELPAIRASDKFKLVATMNPGGDYGKKELSPALRNRFTEIWVPALDDRHDFELIVDASWRHEALKEYTKPLLDFVEWLGERVDDRSILNIRDVLAWVTFTNIVYCRDNGHSMTASEIFHNAAHMTFLDGLHSMPQLSSYSREALKDLRLQAMAKVESLVPTIATPVHGMAVDLHSNVQIGSFALPKGPHQTSQVQFSLEAPTAYENVTRVVRACQLPKPILLEGSPGVGKTSLVTSLANMCGYQLCRINLSDQSDLMDLFGSDLPVEDGQPGQFAWKDAEFLRALQEGHWVLLDEMNLAPQAVLEGLNAVLDHRGTVYIPELGRSFTRHPSFRIFAAQNPLHQGGGRKGLPKSFLNRFTKVYLQDLTADDLHRICCHLFPDRAPKMLRSMIDYTALLEEETMIRKSFGREGAPWEFNLRDVLRWATLLRKSGTASHPSEFLSTVFLQRFRNSDDRARAYSLFTDIFPSDMEQPQPHVTLSAAYLQTGNSFIPRQGCLASRRAGPVMQNHSPALDSLGTCLMNGWLAIVTGPRDSGKTNLIRLLANLTGSQLREISVNNATDSADILGSFEEVDTTFQVISVVDEIKSFMDGICRSLGGLEQQFIAQCDALKRRISQLVAEEGFDELTSSLTELLEVHDDIAEPWLSRQQVLKHKLRSLRDGAGRSGRLQWVDGPLVQALKQGHWLLLDEANLCNPSVLDRLNSLCEADGFLVLNERGQVDGQAQTIKPHPNFRLFMCCDPQFGELSRAMRNRGIEISLAGRVSDEDSRRNLDHIGLPRVNLASSLDVKSLIREYESIRRGVRKLIDLPSISVWPTARLLGEDSANSALIDLAPSLTLTQSSSHDHRAAVYFIAENAMPAYLILLRRFYRCLCTLGFFPYLETAFSHLHHFPSSHLYSIIVGLLENSSHVSAVPAELFMVQPMGSHICSPTMNLLDDKNEDRSNIILYALRLLVAVQLDEEENNNMRNNRNNLVSHDRRSLSLRAGEAAVLEIVSVLQDSIQTQGREALDGFDIVSTNKSQLFTHLSLLAFSHGLREAIKSSSIDFSILQVVVRWIRQILDDCPPHFLTVNTHARELEDIVALKSGLGLTELWASLAPQEISMDSKAEVAELCSSAYADQDSDNRAERRSQVLTLIALRTLPENMSQDESQKLSDLNEKMRLWLKKSGQTQHQSTRQVVDPSLLVCELAILQNVCNTATAKTQTMTLHEFLHFGCCVQHTRLAYLAPYQHLLWALETNRVTLQLVAHLHTQWLREIWTITSAEGLDGPSSLLYPMELYRTMMHGEGGKTPLLAISEHENYLHTRLQMLTTHLLDNTAREDQLTRMLLQALTMCLSCFESPENHLKLRPFKWPSMRDDSESKSAVITDICASIHEMKNDALSRSFDRHLLPALRRLVKADQRDSERLDALGKCWVGLFNFFIELYVPDTPVDPSVMQRYSQAFWKEQKATLIHEIELHIAYEERTSGRTTSYMIQRLKDLLRDMEGETQLDTKPYISSRTDTSRLHAYWEEITNFLTNVVSEAKIESLLSGLTSQESDSLMREEVVQASLSAFDQRLDIAYPDYADISGPLQLALLYIKFGLRLAADAAFRSENTAACTDIIALTAFPSVNSAERLQMSGQHMSTRAFGAPLAIATLAGVALITAVCDNSHLESAMDAIEAVYEQMYGLRSIDQARGNDAERESHMLYKHKPSEQDELTEAEQEEQDFLSLFPQFEEVLSQDQQDDVPGSRKPSQLVTVEQITSLYSIHQALFGDGAVPADISANFIDIRRSEVKTLITQEMKNLPETLDKDSRPFQLHFLCDRLFNLHQHSRNQKAYDFYFDCNVPEAKKALVVVGRLRARLEDLIKEWPEQMVLKDLEARCITFLNLDYRSSVAKLLSALEQLLLHTEDWEMYASSFNNLKAHQASLTALIVEWRRLELASWQDLLRTEAKRFADGVSDWWFRLYDAVVRGVLSATREESEGEANRLTNYLEGLVPLLNDFITHGPMGQYQSRLQLLGSFESYVEHLSRLHKDPQASALQRVCRILHSTKRFYGQFSRDVSAALSRQQDQLEKEIREFIKLASWKDLNVHALKQSAQRTHRQLYKSIRKFRVSLRQPTSNALNPRSDELRDDNQHCPETAPSAKEAPTTGLELPAFPGSGKGYLTNLQRTYGNFEAVIRGDVSARVVWISPFEIESLANDVVDTVKHLSAASVPPSLTSARRTQLQKSLVTRKRKAWSDLLKELKRVGFSPNMKPEVLDQLRSLRWQREQPPNSFDKVKFPFLAKADDYMYRLEALLPELRGSLSDHHGDINTRDLLRGIMLLESGVAMALSSRSRLLEALGTHHVLEKTAARLRVVASTSKFVSPGPNYFLHARSLRSLVCSLADGLEETFNRVQDLRDPDTNVDFAEEAVLDLQSHWRTLKDDSIALGDILRNFSSTKCALILEDEHSRIMQSFEHISSTAIAIRKWSAQPNPLSHYLIPMRDWLESNAISRPQVAQQTEMSDSTASLLDGFLLNVQAILSKLPVVSESRDTMDNLVREDYKTICEMTRLLKLGDIRALLDTVIEQISMCPEDEARVRIARFLPFLDRYNELVEQHLLNQSAWMKALFKLEYILCSVMRTIAKEGFCKPPELEESGAGEEGTQEVDGTGLGEGTGSQNVSKEIEDESQVEGLQGEKGDDDEKVDRAEEDNAIEMSEDFGGELQDVPEGESDDEDQEKDESEIDPEERMGDLDPEDPSQVDEKMWNDEKGDQGEDADASKTQQEGSDQKDTSDIVAKEENDNKTKPQNGPEKEPVHEDVEEGTTEDNEVDETNEDEGKREGSPMDEHIDNVDILDLPEDLNMGEEKEAEEMDDDIAMDDAEDPTAGDGEDGDSADGVNDEMDFKEDRQQDEDVEEMVESGSPESSTDAMDDSAVAQPDVQSGDDNGTSDGTLAGAGMRQGADASSMDVTEQNTDAAAPSEPADSSSLPETSRPDPSEQQVQQSFQEAAEPLGEGEGADTGTASAPQASAPSLPDDRRVTSDRPRSIGDALHEITQRLDQILESQTDREPPQANMSEAQQFEYLKPDDDAADQKQALGPAQDEQVAKLNDLTFATEDDHTATPISSVEDADVTEKQQRTEPRSQAPVPRPGQPEDRQEGVDAALTKSETEALSAGSQSDASYKVVAEEEFEERSLPDDFAEDVELKTKQWQAEGQPLSGAEEIWRLYESLTHHLSYSLCEQLRLILEPTMATRLKGDYRTGKRLNMKKIIPYIASEFTKDKIWLRRTRPSQREYQVLIALDDSKSMAESHSVHLAFQTMALVSKALGRLEVGDIAIARFGETVDILHGFNGGPFTDQAGMRVMSAFHFDQKATQVLSLLQTSLKLLEQAREQRSVSSNSAADLWQLEIIISDGICQDHERLRTVLRKAEENRVMVVFIIIDSLHTKGSSTGESGHQNSILSMNQVAYRNVNGQLDLHVERYLDTFPFEYYVVLRDVEALPDVLSQTLKQFFERIAEE